MKTNKQTNKQLVIKHDHQLTEGIRRSKHVAFEQQTDKE